MKRILSIQSHVASGYVGNRSAVFPLQRLGCEVNFINTVQFSNHTGYGKWTGEIFSAQHIQDVINGLWENGQIERLDAILSGYSRAISTIMDANLTTLIASILLYIFGSGPVRGFSVTLGIGIITSLFTAILFTRLLIVLWVNAKKPKTLVI